jgi:hypothetical protein
LSISDWGDFLLSRLVLDAVFVPFVILVILALFNRSEYRKSAQFRFLLTALLLVLLSRYAFYIISRGRINTRYLFPAAFYVLILCVPGFPVLVRLANYIFDFIPGEKKKILSLLLLAVIGIACVGKALHAPKKKDYIHSVAQFVAAEKSAGKPLLISDADDARRVAWHSKAELMPLASVADGDEPAKLRSAVQILSSKKRRIFFLLELKDEELKKSFSESKTEFPEQLIFLGEFRVKHGRYYSLYKVKTNSGDNSDV